MVDFEVIRRVREALPAAVPVCGNGDVSDVPSYLRMRRETGCEAVMIGRAAVGNPWVFAAIQAHEEGRPLPAPPGPEERLRVFLRHVALAEELAPEAALESARRILCRYLRGLRGAAAVRARAFELDRREAVIELARGFLIGGA